MEPFVGHPRTCRRHTGFGRGGRKKLTRYDVEELRRWARAEGFGATVAEQIAMLRNECPGFAHLADGTLRDILTNMSWYDPTFDREVPLPSEPARPEPMAIPLHPWLVALMVVLCFNFPSRSTARSRG